MLSSKKQLKIRKFNFLPDSQYILPMCFVALTGLTVFNFLFLFFVGFRVNQLAQRKSTFVQLVNGSAIAVSEQEALYRHPEVIKNTVRRWSTLTFNWDGKAYGTKESDGGYKVNNKKITTNAYSASFLLQSGKQGFRAAFLKNLGEITPSELFSGNLRSKFVIAFISNPRQTRPGEWEVDLVSTRILIYAGGQEEEIDFNRTISLRAVDIPNLPLAESSPLDFQLYEMRLAGLEIVGMSELREVRD